MNVIKKRPPYEDDRSVVSVLETMDVDSGKRTALYEVDGTIEAPNWTGDGLSLIYNGCGLLYRYDLKSGKVAQVNTGFIDRCNNDHVLAKSGKRIAVSHHTAEDNQSRIYIVSLADGKATLVTPIAPSYLHGFSPDETTLAYCAERNGQYDIYTIPSEGGIETQLTDTAGLDDGAEFSPCGKYIWFNSTRTGLMQAWRMDKDGSNQTQITFDDDNNWFPHISPDGKRAVCIAYKKGDVAPDKHPPNKDVSIKLFSVNGAQRAKTKVIAELFGGQGTINVNSWSPDSKNIAFVSYRLVAS